MHILPNPTSGLLKLFEDDAPGATMLVPMLEGRSPAEILVDDLHRPSKCVARNAIRMTFASRDVDQAFLDEALAQLRETGGVALVGSEDGSELWTAASPDAVIERLEFTEFDAEGEGYRRTLSSSPAGMQIREVAPDAFDQCLWRDMLLAFCGTAESFFQHGFGLSLVSGNAVVAEAYAPLLARGTMEIGVITAEDHRGRGYATYIAASVIERCLELGRSVAWSCETDNPASVAIAAKLGFQGRRTYPVYAFRSSKR